MAVKAALGLGEHHLLTECMKAASAAVVARTFPGLEHRINMGLRHGGDGRKGLDHPLPVHQATTDLSLLQQNFTEQNRPWVVALPPW